MFSTQAFWLITPELDAALHGRGITNSDALLAAARTPAARRALARSIGLPIVDIWRMAVRADLARVPGIGTAYAELLETAGIATVQALARWRAEPLRERLVTVKAESLLACRLPALTQVAGWLREARKLPVALE